MSLPYNDLNPFLDAMKKEYMKHYPKQGDSWKSCGIDWLEELTIKAVFEIVTPDAVNYETNPDQLIDIAIFCAFLWMRITEDAQ